MMVFTHLLLGVLLGVVAGEAASSLTPALVLAGAIGGALPDLDMLLVHRKSLHYPIGYPAVAAVAAIAYLLTLDPLVLLVAVGAAAAALHALMDVLGGGKEMRPWEETDDRAVHNHVSGRWIAPRRVFYDGSVPDLAISTVAGIAALWILPSSYTVPLLAVLGAAVVYALARRAITRWIPRQYATFSGYLKDRLR